MLTFVTIFSLNLFDLRLIQPNILMEYTEVLLSGGDIKANLGFLCYN